MVYSFHELPFSHFLIYNRLKTHGKNSSLKSLSCGKNSHRVFWGKFLFLFLACSFLSLFLSVCLSMYLSLSVSLCLSVPLFVFLCHYVSLCISLCRFVSLCVFLCLYVSLCVSLVLSLVSSLCLF